MTSQMMQPEPNVRCDYSRPRSEFCDVTFTRQAYASGRDSKEYTGIHNYSATGPFSETGMCCCGKCKWKIHVGEILIM